MRTQSNGLPQPRYNPYRFRRHVCRAETVQGQVHFKTKSFTKEDGTKWHPVIDLETGAVHCDCPDFRFKHAEHEPNINAEVHHCKHLKRAIANCERAGEIVWVDAEPKPTPNPELDAALMAFLDC